MSQNLIDCRKSISYLAWAAGAPTAVGCAATGAGGAAGLAAGGGLALAAGGGLGLAAIELEVEKRTIEMPWLTANGLLHSINE